MTPAASRDPDPTSGPASRPASSAAPDRLDRTSDRASAKHDRLARFYRVIRYLQAHPEGATPDAIAGFVGMSRRTVYRDLQALEGEIEIPLWSEGGKWGIVEGAFLPPLRLTLDEAVAFFFAARLTAQFADRYEPDMGAAFQKLAEILPPVVARHLERTIDVLASRPQDGPLTRHLRTLARAWAEQRVVELTYDAATYSPGRPPRKARVHPYLLEASATTRALYLMGFDESRDAIRTFKLQRILELSLTPDTFEPPDPRTVQEGLGRAWGVIADQEEVEVVLRFDPAIAGLVTETTWHPTEQVTREDDGSVVWRGRVPGTIEIRRWILQWGAQVEVLAPPELRDEVAATYRAAAARY
ncbi:MAG: WYL domain-containing protein [Steroidobacteraceae bacterium]|jgi:proteasome accessory factor B